MVDITAAAVKSLRARTDLPMMKCKQALVEAGGDEDKAVEILKKEAGKIIEKRASNETLEGRIFITHNDDKSLAAMIEIQCESAPVAGGEDIANLGDALSKQLLDGPGASNADELLSQPVPGGSGQTLQEMYEDIVGKIREKIVVNRCVRMDGPAGGYVHHDGKTGVLIQATGDENDDPVLRDVAMHIAALRPNVVTENDLDPASVQAERDRLSEEAKATGKPENIIEKIVDGRMKSYFVEEGVLNLQPFAKDDSKTVSQALKEKGFEATAFERWEIGD